MKIPKKSINDLNDFKEDKLAKQAREETHSERLAFGCIVIPMLVVISALIYWIIKLIF